jgi:glycosyltransferase involved in cell wall biosynthesis
MACGTPVIATRHGAVPEVIEDGRTGVIVEEHTEMAEVIERADAIDPLECRRYVEERFSKERMVADYEAAYVKALEPVASPASS